MDRGLLRTFLEIYPFQPATAVWRTPEVAALARVTFSSGLGLDLGCGDGRLTQVLSARVGGLRLVGLDVDPQETALAAATPFYERVHTTGGATIPEADTTFDYVVSISVMEHIPQVEPVLAEAARVLKPGGRLITTIPSVGFHRVLRGPLMSGPRDEYLAALDRRVAHLRYWTIAQWRSSLTAAGLTLVQATPFLTAPEVRRWETISRMTGGLLHAVSGRKAAPIHIQRSLGMRRAGQRMSRPIAAWLALVLGAGLGGDGAPATEENCGCLLVIASKGSPT